MKSEAIALFDHVMQNVPGLREQIQLGRELQVKQRKQWRQQNKERLKMYAKNWQRHHREQQTWIINK